MKFYTVSNAYIDFLKKTDSSVPNNYEGKRPYIGVVLEINGNKFLAPLTSYKIKQDKIKSSHPTCLKVYNRHDPSEKLGMVQINNMIPVTNDVISSLDFSTQDHKYRSLLQKQFDFLKHNEAKLTNKAEKLYDLVVNQNHGFFSKISCDFEALEKVMPKYSGS
jgi:protein AbiQ